MTQSESAQRMVRRTPCDWPSCSLNPPPSRRADTTQAKVLPLGRPRARGASSPSAPGTHLRPAIELTKHPVETSSAGWSDHVSSLATGRFEQPASLIGLLSVEALIQSGPPVGPAAEQTVGMLNP